MNDRAKERGEEKGKKPTAKSDAALRDIREALQKNLPALSVWSPEFNAIFRPT
jgi:hypothetical protein